MTFENPLKPWIALALALGLLPLVGCATYVTPGAAVNLQAIDDFSIKEKFQTKAAAPLPARIAVVRVQSPGYRSYTTHGVGSGRYSVVTTRDVEQEKHFQQLAGLPQVAGLTTVSRLLLPQKLETIKDLRTACAGLHADLMLLYTFDTGFNVKNADVLPLGAISLGFLPSKTAYVNTTASALLVDVRTGHIYGATETNHQTDHLASVWAERSVVDKARMANEEVAFDRLVDEFRTLWTGILNEYATRPPELGQVHSTP